MDSSIYPAAATATLNLTHDKKHCLRFQSWDNRNTSYSVKKIHKLSLGREKLRIEREKFERHPNYFVAAMNSFVDRFFLLNYYKLVI